MKIYLVYDNDGDLVGLRETIDAARSLVDDTVRSIQDGAGTAYICVWDTDSSDYYDGATIESHFIPVSGYVDARPEPDGRA